MFVIKYRVILNVDLMNETLDVDSFPRLHLTILASKNWTLYH